MKIILPQILRKVNKCAEGGETIEDKLPFEQPLKTALKIYAIRWGVWMAVVIACLIPLAFWVWSKT